METNIEQTTIEQQQQDLKEELLQDVKKDIQQSKEVYKRAVSKVRKAIRLIKAQKADTKKQEIQLEVPSSPTPSEKSMMGQQEQKIKYLKEIIDMMNTDNEKFNKENCQLLIQQIEIMLSKHGVKAKPEEICQFLSELSLQQKVSTEEEKVEFLQDAYVGLKKLYKAVKLEAKAESALIASQLGAETGALRQFTAGILSKQGWMITALFYVADNGWQYRKYKKGYITKDQFWQKIKISSIQTLGGVSGGAAGGAVGFAIGTLSFAGFGSVIGAITGSMIGAMLGAKLSTQAFEHLESRRKKAKKLIKNIREQQKDPSQQRLLSNKSSGKQQQPSQTIQMVNPYADLNDLKQRQEEEAKERQEFRKKYNIRQLEQQNELEHQQQQDGGEGIVRVEMYGDENQCKEEEKEEKVQWIFNEQVKSKKQKFKDFKSLKALYSNYVGVDY